MRSTSRLPQACTLRSSIAGALAACATLALASPAWADGPWVSRSLVLPAREWAFDLGLGVAHQAYFGSLRPSDTAPGFNFEAAYGATNRLELGIRTGARFGDTARGIFPMRPDEYGRLFDTDTYNTGGRTLTNPELRLRYALLDGAFELGAEGRVYLPFSAGTSFGFLVGMPMLIHIGRAARLDTGVLVPVVFDNPTSTVVSFPARLWFQATEQLWVGPMSGVKIWNVGNRSETDVLLGVGLGYQVARDVDIKTEFLFPRINQDRGGDFWGLGGGVQLRLP
jgi:hypothetical protein